MKTWTHRNLCWSFYRFSLNGLCSLFKIAAKVPSSFSICMPATSKSHHFESKANWIKNFLRIMQCTPHVRILPLFSPFDVSFVAKISRALVSGAQMNRVPLRMRARNLYDDTRGMFCSLVFVLGTSTNWTKCHVWSVWNKLWLFCVMLFGNVW